MRSSECCPQRSLDCSPENEIGFNKEVGGAWRTRRRQPRLAKDVLVCFSPPPLSFNAFLYMGFVCIIYFTQLEFPQFVIGSVPPLDVGEK